MFFKGTTTRTQKEIAYEIDSLGGDLNAFTSKETTTYYVKVIDEYLQKGVELLSDIFVNSVLPEEEIEKEKRVILEEIKMSEDTPDEFIHDLFSETVWGGSGLGQNILGKPETVSSFTRDELIGYIKRHYKPDRIVISCSGRVDAEYLKQLLEEPLSRINEGASGVNFQRQRFNYTLRAVEKDLAEVHLCVGVEGIGQGSPYRYAMLLLNTIIGSGVSSRLFQKIREEKALAYSVFSFATSYHDSGTFGVYVGTSPEKVGEALECIKEQLLSFRDTVKDDELERAKKQLKGNLLLSLESSSGRMSNIARQEIYYGRYYSPQEIIQSIERVSIGEVRTLADRLFGHKRFAIVALGPIKKEIIG
jgi:predicted Zn-dependent peptidase